MIFPNELIDKRRGMGHGRVFTRRPLEFEDGAIEYVAIGHFMWWSSDIYVFPNGDVKTLDINGHLYYSGKVVGNEIHDKEEGF